MLSFFLCGYFTTFACSMILYKTTQPHQQQMPLWNRERVVKLSKNSDARQYNIFNKTSDFNRNNNNRHVVGHRIPSLLAFITNTKYALFHELGHTTPLHIVLHVRTKRYLSLIGNTLSSLFFLFSFSTNSLLNQLSLAQSKKHRRTA